TSTMAVSIRVSTAGSQRNSIRCSQNSRRTSVRSTVNEESVSAMGMLLCRGRFHPGHEQVGKRGCRDTAEFLQYFLGCVIEEQGRCTQNQSLCQGPQCPGALDCLGAYL